MLHSHLEQHQKLFDRYVRRKLEGAVFSNDIKAEVYDLDNEKDKNSCEDILKEIGVWAGVSNYKKARGWDFLRLVNFNIVDSVQNKLTNTTNCTENISMSVLKESWAEMCLMAGTKIRYNIIATTYANLSEAIGKRGYPFTPVILGYDYWIPKTEIAIAQDEQWFKSWHAEIKGQKPIPYTRKMELDPDQTLYVEYSLNDIERGLEINGYSIGGQEANGGFGKTISDSRIFIGCIEKFWNRVEKQNVK
jgi:hypothetical protein